jgi:hypothetical protein
MIQRHDDHDSAAKSVNGSKARRGFAESAGNARFTLVAAENSGSGKAHGASVSRIRSKLAIAKSLTKTQPAELGERRPLFGPTLRRFCVAVVFCSPVFQFTRGICIERLRF